MIQPPKKLVQAASDPFMSITARLKNKATSNLGQSNIGLSNLGPSNQGGPSDVYDDDHEPYTLVTKPIVRQDQKIKPKTYYTPQPELI